jgi:uncharacterized coiled-coil protein SlyX
MKTYLAAVLATAIILPACKNNDHNTNSSSNEYVNTKADSLSIALTTRDSTINDLLVSFNQIEQNLDSVEIKQNILSLNVKKQKGDIKENTKEHINAMIADINDLIAQNKKKISGLNNKLRKNSVKINEFQKMIASLNEQIAEKNNTLTSLNEQLLASNAHVTQLQTSVDTLMNNNSSQTKTIAAQITSIHTAFYVIGKSKELQNMKVIDKTGGLLGIGKTAKLNSDFDKNNFTKIDYTHVTNIPINSKKAKIVTSHPSDSYVLEKGTEHDEYTNIRITQPEKFWSESKYLVIVD